MKGKDKCRILKEIRKEIALNNDIEWVVSECHHKGECKGTCPKCESEVRKLERELALRRKLGKAVAITGVSAACMAGLTACSVEDVVDCAENIVDGFKDMVRRGTIREPVELDGDMVYIPEPDDLSGYVADPYYDIDDNPDISPSGDPDAAVPGDEIFVTEGEVALYEEDW